jgi:DNA-3-methyladenine glycosylase I
MPSQNKKRCLWSTRDKLYVRYHDKEWGVPVHNDKKLFEFLILEGMQAGLSWITVLRKRDNFRKAFDNFEFNKVAEYNKNKINSLLKNRGIIRNKLKIEAAVTNANAFIEVRKKFGTFNKYMWDFVKGRPIQNKFKSLKEIPAKTELSDIISKDLKNRGFRFVGSTIIYAHMQATGMVNDHTTDCFRYKELNGGS